MLLTIERDCRSCVESKSVEVFADDLKYYISNKNSLVQNVWPDLDANDREIIMAWSNGHPYYCSSCWDKLFPEEE
jgi:hypothetical protein